MKKFVILSVMLLFLAGCTSPNVGNQPVARKISKADTKEKVPVVAPAPTAVPVITTAPQQPANRIDNSQFSSISFDACGKPEKYQTQAWFKDFSTALSLEMKLTDEGAQAVKEMSGNQDSWQTIKQSHGNLNITDISDMCLSKDGRLAIALYGGEYGSAGAIFRYEPAKNKLERAIFVKVSGKIRIGWDYNFIEFGKRNGTVIPVTSRSGDAGYGVENISDYDFAQNTVRIKKSCGIDATGEKEVRDCTDY